MPVMNTSDAGQLARSLMNEHGLGHVPFRFNRRLRYFGLCKSKAGVVTAIELSAPLVELNSEEQVRDTILHEIAHARAGHAAGHGIVWQVQARALGCNAERYCGADTIMPQGKYQASCNCPDLTHSMFRAPRRSLRCRHCKVALDFRKV